MPKSTRNRSSSRSNRRGRGTATAAVETITRPSQSLPVVICLSLWRWRWELAWTTVTVVVFYNLTAPGRLHLELVPALLVMAAPFPVLLAIGPARRFLRARMWCVITRHRVRACLTEMRTLNWSGNLPFIIGCLSTKTGEVVWLWMRPGLSAEDLENKAETLASACCARQALIGRTNGNAALIRIDIDRRDPLARRHITSPLLDDTHGLPEAQVPDDAVLAFLGPDNTATSESTTEQPATPTGARASGETNPKTKRTKTSAAVPDGESVVLVNGEDVSDYV